ncbi:MAG TPA: hypothetical protein VHV77_13455, partial [Pirellulales bacterium]|nr:hypothetical protein [Pirellulales bacterium]
MSSFRIVTASWLGIAWLGIASLASSVCFAQTVATRGTLPQPTAGAATPGAASVRKLAPGVEQVIDPEERPAEHVSRHDMVEILSVDPTFGIPPNSPAPSMAKDVRFEHSVQSLTFAFKPLRMIRAEMPNEAGRMQTKLVWYMVYRVKNTTEKPIALVPVFSLEDLDTHTTYADKLIPTAIPLIQRREDPNRRLLDTVAIEGEMAPGEERWGIVTWDDLASTIKRLSIFVEGLSTAYQWEDPEGAYKPGEAPGTGRKLT